VSAYRCECGDTACPSCGTAQGTYTRPLRASVARSRQFFREHAGYSHGPRESAAQGREKCARKLAAGESWASERGYTFDWDVDPEVTSADWIADTDDGGAQGDPWATWVCLMRDKSGAVVQSLGGVDFGRNVEPWGAPYARVVQAELALEQMTAPRPARRTPEQRYHDAITGIDQRGTRMLIRGLRKLDRPA
jgi:hypothetical protein